MSSVIIIGAGITGAGIARDLSLRGVEVTLLERNAPASGATGRCHGLLHSGARYAVSDPRAAIECAKENQILKDIASYYVEDTGGLFLAINEDEAAYGDRLLDACLRASIPMEELSCEESPNKHAVRCLSTNDAAIDPFLLTLANLYDARRNGAIIRTGAGVELIEDGRVRLDDGSKVRADVIINATGHECSSLKKDTRLQVRPDKGTILVTERRVCDVVLNRMRPPSDGDIIVPSHTTSLIGTTSAPSSSTVPTREEYRMLMREAVALLPSLKGARIIRAFSGVRPLIGSGEGRSLSRDYRLEADNGIITVAGGKLTTYRLIAEKAADMAMRLLGERGECRTREPLPNILRDAPARDILCNCEQAAGRLIEMDFLRPADLWKYNRIGFGACQGMRCAKNAGRERELLEERWKGVKPVLDDVQLRQSYLTWASYMSRLGSSK
ncbi:FAD-dependent oxidoreductase [Methanocella conradii]|uniref:FAD-dependent oxidoreductase n=1 Tax=Methanocella conradii TaxID=1175444 RepID=UPI00157D0D51|nr:FAD-dependent oxidoreductase [Methanocella conradii]